MGLSREDIAELSQHYYEEIFGFIQNRIKNLHMSEDLTQDTFLLAQKGRNSLRENRNVRGWLFAIARNRVNNYFNRERESWEFNEGEDTEDSRENDPFLKLLDRQQEARIQELLDALPPRQRQCLSLFYQGFMYHEIAEILKLNMNTVKSNLYKARASALQWLERHRETPPGKERP